MRSKNSWQKQKRQTWNVTCIFLEFNKTLPALIFITPPFFNKLEFIFLASLAWWQVRCQFFISCSMFWNMGEVLLQSKRTECLIINHKCHEEIFTSNYCFNGGVFAIV